MIFGIDVLQGGEEAIRDAVFGVKINGTLSSCVTDNISVSKILSNDTASWLLLLGNLIAVSVGVGGEVAAIIVGGTGSAGYLDVSRAELGVVEQESCLCSSLLFEGDGGILSFAGGSDLELGDLATEK